MAFAQIYDCPNCGETINVTVSEQIDCDRDEVYYIPICSRCYRSVRPKKAATGEAVFRPLSQEEIFWELCGPDDDPWGAE